MFAMPRLKSRHLAAAVAGRRALLPVCACRIYERPSSGILGFYFSSGGLVHRYGCLAGGLIHLVSNFGLYSDQRCEDTRGEGAKEGDSTGSPVLLEGA